ncbi:MAG: phosphatidylinositol-specific phospholipase C1-like protein [Verrucomicrobiota bacterium]
MKWIQVAIFLNVAALGLFSACKSPSPAAGLRLNQIQVIGTHNSYHLRGHESLLALIAKENPKARDELNYEHRPLPEQLEMGIRQIELDCHADPNGGLYAKPLGIERVLHAGLAPLPPYDPEGRMRLPGIKVMHMPDIDFASSALTLIDALRQVRAWSLNHPRHVPIFILLELKEDASLPESARPVLFEKAQLSDVESEILSVFPADSILKPDDIRGNGASLPEALRRSGWPLLDSIRGRVMFGLDDEGSIRDRYLEGHPALQGRLIFVSVPPANPAAAWMKRNDPIGGFEEIQKLVTAGFLVRTRADSDTAEARANDSRKRERALASGAQFVSTDYPDADRRLSSYSVQLPKHAVARMNPVSRANAKIGDVE